MTLNIISPIMIGEDNITASSVDLEDEHDGSETCALGDQRRVGTRLYEVSATTTNDTPSEESNDWFDAGPANRYAAFDLVLGLDEYRPIETSTVGNGEITYTITGATMVSGMAFFGLVATKIKVVATYEKEGDTVDFEYDLKDITQYNGSRWRWRNVPKQFETKYLNLDVSIKQGSTIKITVSNGVDNAEVGVIAMGVSSSYGTVTTGTTRGGTSRSIKKTEGTLTSLLRRTPSIKVTYSIILENYEATGFYQEIDRIDGVGAVFSCASNHPQLAVYGASSPPQGTAVGNGITKLSLEVTEL